MSCITRSILRWGLIGTLALGGITLLVGPERVAVGLAQIRMKAQSVVDGALDNPMALRRQLQRLADEYPDRIAEVRGELAEVEHQIGQFERDVEIAERVVAMTTTDLTDLKALVQRAEEVQLTSTQSPLIRVNDIRMSIPEAYREGRRISDVRETYLDRVSQNGAQLQILREQQNRLSEILANLENEYNTYQAQLWQLDREIDAIERNEWLIELIEQQQATLKRYERYGEIDNLNQLKSKLAELQTIQKAQLDRLREVGVQRDYEELARDYLDMENISTNPFDDVLELEGNTSETSNDDADNSVAWAGPIVIE